MNLYEIRKKFKIKTGEIISKDKFETILDAATSQEITKEELNFLLQSLPHIKDLQKNYLETIKNIVDGLKSSQEKAFESMPTIDTIEKTIEIIDKLINEGNDDFKLKALEYLMELNQMKIDYEKDKNKKIQKMNKENNKTWREVIKVTVVSVIAISTAFLTFKKNNNT